MSLQFKPDFLIIPYQLIEDRELEATDRLIYGLIYWFEHLKDGHCSASNDTFAALLHITPRAVQNSLTNLEGRGYIEREYKDESKRHRSLIHAKITFKREKPERTVGDTRKQSELSVTPERTVGDTTERTVGDHISNRLKSNKNKNSLCVPFEEFWKLYPRHVEKKKASMKWEKLPCEAQAAIMADLPARTKSDQWMRGFIPHPTTYLNGERWNDELTSNAPQRSGSQVDRF